MNGVILAAGRGSRLAPLTDTKPKAMVELGESPMLSHCFKHLVALGADRLVVVVGYRGAQIQAFYGDEFAGILIEYRVQAEQLGMAHALLAAEDVIDDDFMLMDCDTVTVADLAEMVRLHPKDSVDGTLLVQEVSREAAKTKAIVDLDDDGTITGIVNKPDDPPEWSAIVAGFHTFTPAAFDASRLVQRSVRGEYELSATINILIASGRRLVAVERDPVLNVNTRDDLEKARELIRS